MATTEVLIQMLVLVQFQLLFIGTTNLTENDSVRKQVMEDFMKYCPDTPTCTHADSTAAPNSSLHENWDQQSCCHRCSCEPHCGNQCCPDKPGIIFRIHDETLNKGCVYAQYRPYETSSLNGKTYQMKTGCPTTVARSQYSSHCEKSVFDYALSDSLDIVPVTSKATGQTYKDRNCAFCNQEDTSDLIYWEMHFECSPFNASVPNTPEEILKLARNDKRCNIFFHPDYSSKINIAECDNLINTCNVTGAWESYEQLTEIACMSYKSRFDLLYNNIHCFLCNNGRETFVPNNCSSGGNYFQERGMIAILDFNRLAKAKESKASHQSCPFQHVFDKYKNTCRRLWCSDGLRFNDGICVPLFQYFSGKSNIVYAMTFALQPQLNSSSTIDANLVKTEFIDDIVQRVDNMGLSTIDYASFIKLNKSVLHLKGAMIETNRSLLASDIDYIAIEIRIGEKHVYNVSERLETITGLLLNSNFSGCLIYRRNITESQFRKATSALFDLNKKSGHNTTISHSTIFPDWLKDGLACGYDDHGRGIIPLAATETNDNHTIFDIVNDPFCPKLILKIDDYRVSFDKHYAYLTYIGGKFSRSELSFSENGDYVSVCHNSYICSVERYYAREQSKHNNYYTPMTILTILCTSLSLISLLVTLTVYCTLRVLRTVPGLNNMGLVISLIGFMSLTLLNACVDVVEIQLCRVIGVTLHFSLLSSFGWMFICTFHMAKVFTNILERSVQQNRHTIFIHYVILVELISISVVVVTIVVSLVISDGENIGYTEKPCYVDPSTQLYNVAIPVGIVVVANFAMYLFVIITLSRIPDIRKNSSHERNNIIIFLKLSTITGMTWVFGFIYQFTSVDVFAYIFTVLNSGQGVFIMFSFVVNKRVYGMCQPKRKQTSSITTPTITITSTSM